MMYYSMDTIQDNCIYHNNYTSDLSEFTKEQREILISGGYVQLDDNESCCINADYI